MVEEKAKWLKNRLGVVEPGEVLSRLSDVGRHLMLRTSLNRVAARGLNHVPIPHSLKSLPTLGNGKLECVSRDSLARVLETADHWLDHRVSLFSLRNFCLGDPIEWNRDYSSGIVGPMKYSGFINHRDIEVSGNVKYVWELNRLQHLVVLALAAKWTGKKIYKDEIYNHTHSWCAQNPFMRGLNWKSPLEAGVRLISWAFVCFLTGVADPQMLAWRSALPGIIYQHQYFIRQFRSKHSSANNHLIGELAGLYIAAVFWPCYPKSWSWRSFAKRKLIQEIIRQVETDGVGKEQSTEYLLYILEFFLLAGALGQTVGDAFPQSYWDRLSNIISFLSATSDRSGNLPMFGDGDSGQSVWLPEAMPERVRSLVRLGSPNERSAPDKDLRSILLLWGQESRKLAITPAGQPNRGIQSFSKGGYYVLTAGRGSEDELMVILDSGPLGLPPLYAHGHADALSFWLSYGGEEFLVDPGTYCYTRSSIWRSYFRGTAAHNTVRVDREDQSVTAGPFLWRHPAHSCAELSEVSGECLRVEGFHDGYRRLGDPVMHRRILTLYPQSRRLVVVDSLECHSSHDIEIFFHFSERCQIQNVGTNQFTVLQGKRQLGFQLDARLEPTLYRGSDDPISGWVSRTFDTKEPAFTLAARAKIKKTAQFAIEIYALESIVRVSQPGERTAIA